MCVNHYFNQYVLSHMHGLNILHIVCATYRLMEYHGTLIHVWPYSGYNKEWIVHRRGLSVKKTCISWYVIQRSILNDT